MPAYTHKELLEFLNVGPEHQVEFLVYFALIQKIKAPKTKKMQNKQIFTNSFNRSKFGFNNPHNALENN